MRTKRMDDVRGYKLDFSTNTLTINYKFHAALSDYGSSEYKRYCAILRDFPNLKVIVEAGRKISSTRPTKRLTYQNMDSYMSCFENADELKAVFAIVQQRSKVIASPYKYVRDWFAAQFPGYKASVTFDGEKPAAALVALPDPAMYKQKDNVCNIAEPLPAACGF